VERFIGDAVMSWDATQTVVEINLEDNSERRWPGTPS
jgi:hypothetical protein